MLSEIQSKCIGMCYSSECVRLSNDYLSLNKHISNKYTGVCFINLIVFFPFRFIKY